MKSAKEKIEKKKVKPNSHVPSVSKALDILETLAEEPTGLTLQDLTEVLERSMGEIYRVTVYLAERGYIFKNPDTDRYTLTMRLFELANRQNPTTRLIETALPYLKDISNATEQSCHLAMLSNQSLLVLASQPSPRHAGYSVRTGAIIPFENTSSGPVILSHKSPAEQAKYLSDLKELEKRQILTRMKTIKSQGYDERESSLVLGIRNISIPIFDHSGVVAALTMGYLNQVNQVCSTDTARRHLIEAATQISVTLGHTAS